MSELIATPTVGATLRLIGYGLFAAGFLALLWVIIDWAAEKYFDAGESWWKDY